MKRTGKILLAVFIPLGAILSTFVLITQVPLTDLHPSSITDHSRFFRDAVEANPILKEKPLTEISMLGSHDALSNDIHYGSMPNSSETHPIVNNPVLLFFGRGAIARYAKAQQHNIYDQLTAGVRYIDARITYINGTYYTSHGLVSNTLEHNLLLILKFLDENPGEFILFNINNYYPADSSFTELNNYMDTVKYNNKCLSDYVNYPSSLNYFYELTYNNITDNGTKAGAVLFSDEPNLVYPYNQFSNSKTRNKWHNTSSNEEINKKIIEEAKYCKTLDNTVLKINQTQQTPNTNEIWTTFVNWSLLSQAQFHNASMINNENVDLVIDAIPIYQADYCTSDYENFNNRIIEKLLTRNKNLKNEA